MARVLLVLMSVFATACADEHGRHHHIPPEVERAAQLEVFTQHLGAAEYGPANWIKSPNYTTSYRGKGKITTVVIHTVQGSYNGCISWFQNTKAKVSAHYVISKTGAVTQMVKEKDIGWHAGSANGYTIGIEHEGYISDKNWATPQMVAASAKLTCYLAKKYGLSATKQHIKGHVELPKQTHTDPGKYWPWATYLAQVSSCMKGGGVVNPPTCAGGCDDGKACTKDSCVNGKCSYSWDNGKVCWDGDACTVGEKCSNGACVGGKITKDCNDNNPCTNDGCKASKCTHAANNNTCSDGNACTKGDTCKSKSCIGGAWTNCNDGNPCTKDACSGGKCSHVAINGACSDGQACTSGDYCSGGKCVGGKPKACDDGNPCTTGDVCNPATGGCNPGKWKSCGQGDVCSAGTCDPKAGGCQAKNEGTACDDGNPCTAKTVCKSGSCGGGTSQACDDGNPCTNDSCNGSGCGHLPNTMLCDDGDACTHADACTNGVCKGLLVSCDDGDPCTTGQLCSAGKCSAGESVCDDGNDCTSDNCAGGVCSHAAIVVDCNDGNDCTVKEYCDMGICQGGQVKSCDDGDPCTEDRCEPDQGCAHHPSCGEADGSGDRPDAGGGATQDGSSITPDGVSGSGPIGGAPPASPAGGCTAGGGGGETARLLLICLSTGLLWWRRRDRLELTAAWHVRRRP